MNLDAAILFEVVSKTIFANPITTPADEVRSLKQILYWEMKAKKVGNKEVHVAHR